MLQLYELCRLCAQKKRNKLDLFTERNNDESKILLTKISLCLSVQVTREDLLPKMVCIDCLRAVEQFNAFRVKCHKAEERLNKMLSLALPNKLTVTRIKQECLESDFYENSNLQMKLDSPQCNETVSLVKSIQNVKSEVEESDNEVYWNQTKGSDLIQIISEEIVNQAVDIKQPHIEIISEDFHEEFKNIDFNESENVCDIKVIPENLLRIDDVGGQSQEREDPVIKALESDQDVAEVEIVKKNKVRTKRKSRQKQKENTEEEIDEKYLTLKEGESCDIDFEEMDALIKKKLDPNTIFNCDRCNKSFKFFKCLRKHKHWHDSQPEVFICDFCKKENSGRFEFCSLKTLNNHIQRKHLSANGSKVQCRLCEKVLSSQGQLNAHCKKVHDESGAACQVCGKTFKNKARLKGHFKVHQEERPYVCDLCGQSFKWSNALKVHIQWHRQEKNFLCSECGKKFTAKKNLVEHLNIHMGKRPYVCEECNASFVQLSAYSKHLYLHNEGSRIHKCDKCERSYSHAYLLKQHLVRHSGLRPFECSTCHRSFKSQSDLCCHVKIHQEKQHGCHVCGKKFTLSKTLRDHMVRHTGIKHRCPVPGCGKSYTQRFSLTKHFSKQHPSLSIVRKKSGQKAHLSEKRTDKISGDGESGFIRYDFVEKEVELSVVGRGELFKRTVDLFVKQKHILDGEDYEKIRKIISCTF